MSDARWSKMPPDVLVLLIADAESVRVNFRPDMDLKTLEAAGQWARARALAWTAWQIGGFDSEGTYWTLSEEHRAYVLLGRAPMMNGDS